MVYGALISITTLPPGVKVTDGVAGTPSIVNVTLAPSVPQPEICVAELTWRWKFISGAPVDLPVPHSMSPTNARMIAPDGARDSPTRAVPTTIIGANSSGGGNEGSGLVEAAGVGLGRGVGDGPGLGLGVGLGDGMGPTPALRLSVRLPPALKLVISAAALPPIVKEMTEPFSAHPPVCEADRTSIA